MSAGETIPRRRPLRVGFQLSITTLFVAVALGVGLSLVYLSFDRAKGISRSAASTFIDRVAEHTAERVDGQFKSVLGALDILRQHPSVISGAITENPRLYALLAALLRNNVQLYNLYVGYDDGRFIELDSLDRIGPLIRAELGAPPHAEFRLVVIDRSAAPEVRKRATVYLSRDLTVVSEAHGATDYDPRERPWYRGAFDPGAGAVTDPYVFKLAALTGYTVRLPLATAPRGVIAGDLILADTETFLKAQRLGRSGVVFLFDDRGRVIAHPRMSEHLKGATSPTGILELPGLDQVETIEIAQALADWRQGASAAQQFFQSGDGRTYVAAFRSIETAGSANLRLAVVAPLDEFFAEIESARRSLFVIAVGLVVSALPIAFWLGSKLSRSLRAIAQETDRIQRFEMEPEPQPIRSTIREIDELGRSVSTMRTVVRTFSSFIPKRLVQQLVATGTALRPGGVRREVTVLFTDIEGFTNITENADPESVMLHTSRYLAALSEAIAAHQGTVDKFVGDAVMAIWNAPADDADHVGHACAAVLACRKANDELNAAFEQEGWPAYRTRFGLHTGEAVVGNIGSADRMNYSVLGAVVNLAARLESLNKDYGTAVLVSEAIRGRAADRFVFRPVDRIAPKGFAATFAIYELISARGSSSEQRDRAIDEPAA